MTLFRRLLPGSGQSCTGAGFPRELRSLLPIDNAPSRQFQETRSSAKEPIINRSETLVHVAEQFGVGESV
jgi:hypothetical protein